MKIRHVVTAGGCLIAQLLFTTLVHPQTAPAGLQVSPTSVDFGADPINADAPAHTITVTNPTNSTITFEQIIASGIDFSEKHDCGQTLAPGAQCTIQVSFIPVISGPRTGNLTVMESTGNAHIVALTGSGT
ncbi:MAG TPA: choice-of-anchor D domain-containing protein [Terriglobales bacterium]|nr:choice-of-anchor D domain-containing protein [Terriglobales bacterium]